MKKTIVILLVLVIAISSSFAALIQVGPTGRYTGGYEDLEEVKNFGNYQYGLDARINLGMFGVAANALLNNSDDYLTFSTIMSANLRADLGLLEFALGAGFDLPITWNKDAEEIYLDNQPIDKFMEVFKGADVLVRASGGVNLGGLGVALDYILPYKTIKSAIENDADLLETVKKGKASISLLVNLL